MGIAFNQNQPRLKEWINNWVLTNHRNGKLDAIYVKFQGLHLPVAITKQ